MTAMPQMVALFNGVGGGAAALVALAEFHHAIPEPGDPERERRRSRSCWRADRRGLVHRLAGRVREAAGADHRAADHLPGPEVVNALLLAGAASRSASRSSRASSSEWLLVPARRRRARVRRAVVLPIGGADMPVVISLLNAFTGLAAAATASCSHNNVLIIAGTLVGASGTLLTLLMAHAMNRSLANVLFGAFGQVQARARRRGRRRRRQPCARRRPTTSASCSPTRSKVIIVPGYGMAVAQAQHEVRELAERAREAAASTSSTRSTRSPAACPAT